MTEHPFTITVDGEPQNGWHFRHGAPYAAVRYFMEVHPTIERRRISILPG